MPNQALAEIFAAHMLNGVLAGVVLAAAADILLRVIRGRDSSIRFLIWFKTLAAVVLLPVLRFSANPSLGVSPGSSGVVLNAEWAWGFLAAWVLIAGIGLIRLGFGLNRLRKIRRACEPVDSNVLEASLQAALRNSGAKRKVALCVSDEIHTPTAIGLLNPAVVIPRWAMKELSAEELQTVMLHELAHLERWDDWTNLLQKVCKTLFFFHPAVWWIESKLALEREMACDDFVLTQTGNPHAYAECLVHLAERSFLRRGLALAQAAVGRVRHTSLRVMQILSKNRVSPQQPGSWAPAAALAGVLAMAGAVTAAHAPSLIAFRDSASPVTLAAIPAPTADFSLDRSWLVPAKATQPVASKPAHKKQATEIATARSFRPLPATVAAPPDPMQLLVAAHMLATAPAFVVVMQEEQIGNVRFITWQVKIVEVVFHPTPEQMKSLAPARIT